MPDQEPFFQFDPLWKELETLLLGERVSEPKGFANTYHHWTGKDGANTSDPDNWSDYVYANDGSELVSWAVEQRVELAPRPRPDDELPFAGPEEARAAGGCPDKLPSEVRSGVDSSIDELALDLLRTDDFKLRPTAADATSSSVKGTRSRPSRIASARTTPVRSNSRCREFGT